MSSTISADGTTIGFDRLGEGPPVILVLGAFNDRAAGAAVAARLAEHFSVINYDRRGRGSSTNTLPYSVDREIEDLQALLQVAGGQASVFGYSSGAVLSLRAAAAGLPIISLALYDPPFQVSGHGLDYWAALATEIGELVRAGRRGDAVEAFQTRGVGIPPEVVAHLRQAPFWPGLEAIAHTLEYEARILACPIDTFRTIGTPVLVISGGSGPDWLQAAAATVAESLPRGELATLPGQTHDLVADVLAPVLTEFYGR